MSMDNCLNTLRAAGKIDPRREADARRIYEEVRNALGDELGADEAASQATSRALERMRAESAEKRRQTLLQASKQREIESNLRRYRDPKGREDWAQAATAHLDSDQAASFSNVEARRKAILGTAHGKMVDVLATFRRDLLGRVRENAQLDDMVRVSFGEAVDSAPARELGKAWGETAEYLRQRFNQAGGHVAKRKDWGLPQSHDMLAVRKAGFAEWRAFVKDRLDPSRMYDELTGRPMTPAQVERTMKGVFETISTGGWNAVEPSGLPINGKLGNRRADPRYLAFKNADAWLEYHGKFSTGTPYDVMNEYLHGMSRDIALMEVLGPNPSATLRWLEQMVKKRASEDDALTGGDKRSNQARKASKLLRDMFGQITGATTTPVDTRLANFMGSARTILVSAQLGSASLSAMTDLAPQVVTAKFNGIPATGVLKGYLKYLTPHVTADQKLAVRLGLIAENWSQIAAAQARFADQASGSDIARRLADGVLRVSGLSPWTQAGKWAFGTEFLGFLADQRGKSFDALSPAIRRAMERYGIKRDGWDIIRGTDLHTHRGATFLRPEDIARRTDLPEGVADELATRVLEMVQTETTYAIPEAGVRGRSQFISDLPPGTIAGEIMRSSFQYKGFGVSLVTMQLRRTMMQKGVLGKAGYAASLIIGIGVMGALSIQAKQIAKGLTPVDMTGEHAAEFWGKALLQGGGFGIYGDFIASSTNRFGGGIGETLAGPLPSAGGDVFQLVTANAQAAALGEKTRVGRDTADLVGKYTPGSSLWYARLAFNRVLLDQLRKEVDPDYQEHFHAMEQRARSEMGQEYWWRPGEVEPEMAE